MNFKIKAIWIGYDETKGYCLHLSIVRLVYLTSALPFVAFLFCVVWSIVFNFKQTTSTHCEAWNVLPSISAAIGAHTPQFTIWCIAITLHLPFRFLFVSLYYKRNVKILGFEKIYLAKLASLLNTAENISLLGLTYFTSSTPYTYVFHEKFFLTFIITSQSYMFLTCTMLKYGRINNVIDKNESCSIRMKNRLFLINFLSFVIAGFFFVRHNTYCEPGMYTLFTLFEYIVVVSNIAFHLTAAIDFKEGYITIDKYGFEVR